MNIKQHIEAGHYPTIGESKRVCTVATRGGAIAYIYTTHHHPDWPIVGGIEGEIEPRCWREDGGVAGPNNPHAGSRLDLLPPPPRKMEVKRYLVVARRNEYGPFANEVDAAHVALAKSAVVVTLTGSYEEEW